MGTGTAQGKKGFSFDVARNYWKFAPSAKGKVNTADLCVQDESEFYKNWRDLAERRFDHYWEDQHYVRHYSELFAGKRVLSFGSGMGFNEVYFMRAGAAVTCADIVPSNLKVIERVCKIEGLKNGSFLFMPNSAETNFPGPFDHIYVRGSLMTMPADLQMKALANFKNALNPGGLIILNLYTKKFVNDTCGVDDPVLFARASDPSVGEVHCPWSDWHDDAKLLKLAGDDMFIPYCQYWNQGWYVWYALARKHDFPGDQATKPFLRLDELGRGSAEVVTAFTAAQLTPVEATAKANPAGGLQVHTRKNQFHYALTTKELKRADLSKQPNRLHLDVDLQEGAIGISILDAAADKMVMSRALGWDGRHPHYFSLRHVTLPERFKIIVSNNCVKGAAISKFILHGLSLEYQR